MSKAKHAVLQHLLAGLEASQLTEEAVGIHEVALGGGNGLCDGGVLEDGAVVKAEGCRTRRASATRSRAKGQAWGGGSMVVVVVLGEHHLLLVLDVVCHGVTMRGHSGANTGTSSASMAKGRVVGWQWLKGRRSSLQARVQQCLLEPLGALGACRKALLQGLDVLHGA